MPTLPPDFLADLRTLESAYLSSPDPIRQSGFGGGEVRWREERGPILDAIESDGDLLDVGCANGYLLECLGAWGRERGVMLTPWGVDIGPRLIAEAKRRQSQIADHFFVANAWDWHPPRRWRYVYSLLDCVPEPQMPAFVQRLLDRTVEPGGRLILGWYGSRSRNEPPWPMGDVLRGWGYPVAGTSIGGNPPLTSFAWIDRA